MKKNLKFIHITKNGGTYIEHKSKKIGKKWGRNCQIYKELGEHSIYFNKIQLDDRIRYDWFTIVRNPYDRIISEFNWYHKRVKQDKKNIFNFKIFKENYTKFNKKCIIKFNKTVRELIKNRDIENGNHFSEQYLYFDNVSKIHILKYENIKEEFDRLMNNYNINLIWDNNDKINHKRINLFSVKDFDDETLILINKVYYEDFLKFGYSLIKTSKVN
jgi:hypothetical protein